MFQCEYFCKTCCLSTDEDAVDLGHVVVGELRNTNPSHSSNELSVRERREVSFFSYLYHFLAYSVKRTKMRLDKGMFIVSIDVDVGSSKLDLINRGKYDVNISKCYSEYLVGKMDEAALPIFAETFDDFEIPVTFAIRGQLAEVQDSVLELLLESPIRHDIGAHGYYHREFTGLSREEADGELRLISEGMKKFGVIPRSFVFPRAKVAHLDLLEKYRYKCYRGYGDFMHDRMHIEKQGRLYNVHPSLYLGRSIVSTLPKKIIDIAVAKRLPLHVWFHSWTFGGTQESMRRSVRKTLLPLLSHAKKRERGNELTFETMLSAAEKVEKLRTQRGRQVAQ